jgi:hypothetical protein
MVVSLTNPTTATANKSSLFKPLDEPDFARAHQFAGLGGGTRSQRQIASGRTTLPQSQNQA